MSPPPVKTPTLYAQVMADLQRRGAGRPARVLRAFYAALDELVDDKRARFSRVLPLGDYLVDRWDKARALGFGEGSSIYDSSLVIGAVRVGRGCWIGPFTILDGSGGLEIGDHCTVSAGVHLYSHDNIQQTLTGAPIERAPVRIGHHVYLGPHAVVTRGVEIGDHVVVGAHSLVRENVPAGSKVAGTPARVIGRT